MVRRNNIKDWKIDSNDIIVSPNFEDGYSRYDVSIKSIIDGINKSGYLIDGSKVDLNLGDLGELPNGKLYKLEMLSTNGNIIKDKRFSTELYPVLYSNNTDITNTTEAKYFKWTRISGKTEADQIADAEWNLRWATGAKLVPITCEDVNRRAMFQVQFVTEQEEKLWVKNMYDNYINK